MAPGRQQVLRPWTGSPGEELLYARVWTSETQRAKAIQVWNIHYNYHRAHTAADDQPPASRLRQTVTNVMTQIT